MNPLAQLQLVATAVLIAWAAAATWGWNREVHDYAQYRAAAEASAKLAQDEQTRKEKQYEDSAKTVAAGWNAMLPGIRSGAVAAYRRAHPDSVCAGTAGTGGGVRPTGGQEGADGAPAQRLACTGTFIADCAQDAGQVMKLQEAIKGMDVRVE